MKKDRRKKSYGKTALSGTIFESEEKRNNAHRRVGSGRFENATEKPQLSLERRVKNELNKKDEGESFERPRKKNSPPKR